ncbi:MAG: aldo/keto reductase [Thermoflexales bacterium]|nr:aldo/keto reductase [Thermoflexales bacterium]
MQYRTFGKLDWKVSVLGFGAMRLPLANDGSGKIDEPEATRMLHYAIDHGVNYVDTAYGYHGGESEKVVGRALQGGYRDKVKLVTKLPCWLVKTVDDFDRLLNEQLERLQTDHVDVYLLHALNAGHWDNLTRLGVFDWVEKAQASGRLRHLGFSFHDEYEVFQRIVDGYDKWVCSQVQYNFMDEEHQAGTRGIQYAASKGLAVVIMEPIRGGRLSIAPPPPIREIWETAPIQRTPADWALQWVWNHPEVSVVLSGMSAMQHVEENIASAERSRPGQMTEEELALIGRVRDKYREICPIPCTKCEYCLPCPNEVSIPRILEIYNEALMYNEYGSARLFYSWLGENEWADNCIECLECEDKCPQNIDIADWLKKADELLAAR